MHNVVIDEPYRFIPPYRGKLWAWVFRSFYLGRFLRKTYGIKSWRIDGLDRLRASLRARHGILLCPNHCRPSDPMLMGLIVRETPCYIYAMASWHIFKQAVPEHCNRFKRNHTIKMFYQITAPQANIGTDVQGHTVLLDII